MWLNNETSRLFFVVGIDVCLTSFDFDGNPSNASNLFFEMIKNERHRFAFSKVFKSSKNLPLPNGNWAAIHHEINKSPNKFKETSDENSICFNQWLSVRNLSSMAQIRLEPFENSFSFFQFKTVVMCVSGRMNMYWVLLLYMQSSKKCVLWICHEDHNDDECFRVVLVSLDYKLKRPPQKRNDVYEYEKISNVQSAVPVLVSVYNSIFLSV